MTRMISEIINQTAALKNENDKINFLRANDNSTLRQILRIGLDERIKILLPPGAPPYKPTESKEAQGMLFTEARKLYLFVQGGNDSLTPFRREMLFIQMLEAVDPEDSKILIAMKDRKLPIPATLVNKAFPDMNIQPIVEVAEPSTLTKSEINVKKIKSTKSKKEEKNESISNTEGLLLGTQKESSTTSKKRKSKTKEVKEENLN